MKLATRDCINKDCAPTIARRIRINHFDDVNERCKASNPPNRLSGLLHSTRPFTFDVQRHLISRRIHRQFRTAAHNSWSDATAVVS